MSIDFIKSCSLKYFDGVGITSAIRPPSIDLYSKWVSGGLNGQMEYLKRHLPQKENPQKLLGDSKSWIVLTLNYDTQEPLSAEIAQRLKSEKKGWIARYARGEDYHKIIQVKLEGLVSELKAQFPAEKFMPCVDTKPVLERDTAARAGLGWIGKNSCLIDQKKGSFFFIAEILTTLDLESDKPVFDHCGTCTRCIEACPTQALEEPRVLNANKCISYWTIESKTQAPPELSKNFGQNIFGCDICQDVCPWNQKARKINSLPEQRESGEVDLEKLLKLSSSEVKLKLKNTALERTKPEHFIESVKVALRNSST